MCNWTDKVLLYLYVIKSSGFIKILVYSSKFYCMEFRIDDFETWRLVPKIMRSDSNELICLTGDTVAARPQLGAGEGTSRATGKCSTPWYFYLYHLNCLTVISLNL